MRVLQTEDLAELLEKPVIDRMKVRLPVERLGDTL